MKKLNKRGFTLIELLAVLVILVVIMAIAIPSVTSSIERSKQKEYDAKVKLIVSAAELCQDAYKNKFVSGNDVSVEKLIELKYLTKEEIKDPFTGDNIKGCVYYDGTSFKFGGDKGDEQFCEHADSWYQ